MEFVTETDPITSCTSPCGLLLTVGSWVAIIAAYGRFRSKHPDFKDPFMVKYGLPGPLADLDSWSMFHLTAYTYLGYAYPDCTHFSMGCGVAWEAFEHFLGSARPSWLGGFGDIPDNINIATNEKWWYGRVSDLVMNFTGLLGGYLLSK